MAMGGAVASMAEGMGMATGVNMTMEPSASTMSVPYKTKSVMHMAFFWGSRVDILFSGWPGDRGIGVYLIALFLIFVIAFIVELLSFFPHRRHLGSKRITVGLLLTGLSTIRTGLSYMVMLAVMSFNGGVLLAAVVGHALGFFMFGTGLFFGSRGDGRDGVQHINGHQAIGNKC